LNITSDKLILSWISGYKIPFVSKVSQPVPPIESVWSSQESTAISGLLNDLLKKGAICQINPCKRQFISKIFLRPKPDGSFRLILNLKK